MRVFELLEPGGQPPAGVTAIPEEHDPTSLVRMHGTDGTP
jgi:hypothetical protein